MKLADQQVTASTISEGWHRAAQLLAAQPGRHAFHLVVRFSDPETEDQNLRTAVDEMLSDLDLQPVVAVANTIFPQGLADTSRDPERLVERYRALYPTLRQADRKNQQGTYFGRLVARPPDESNQFTNTLEKLRRSVDNQRMKSTYEIDMTVPDLAMSTYVAEKDQAKRMGFPCLSFLSFHLDVDALHLAAFYRNQYMIERGYGNYLGLGRLLAYIAADIQVPVGELLVVSGHTRLDQRWGQVRSHLDGMAEGTTSGDHGESGERT